MLNMKPDNRRKRTLTCIVRIIIISFDDVKELGIKKKISVVPVRMNQDLRYSYF